MHAATATAAILGLAAAASAQPWLGSATYRLEFQADWSAATHPTAFPPRPHFSGLVGAVHNEDGVLWEAGALASDGMESMAETGSKTLLIGEVNDLIDAGDALSVISGGGIPLSPGSVTVEFEVRQDFPLVTVVSMIAPSPDWFVGTRSLSLRQLGTWVETLEFDLRPYDSGTDSGPSYTSPNMDTVPPEPIRLIASEFPFTGTPALGRFVLTRTSTRCPADYGGDGLLTIFDFLEFLNDFDARDPMADFDGDGEFTIFDFLAFQNAFQIGC
ncbi:MAG: spondin domain-containing protein [Planctomycetota bacterium]